MQAELWNCQCCGLDRPQDQFYRGHMICATCETLPVFEAVTLTRMTCAKFYSAKSAVNITRKDRRNVARFERYAKEGKRCTACHGRKKVEAYNKCAPAPDGLQPICRDCNRLRVTLMAAGGLASWRTVRDAMRSQNDNVA